MVNSFQIYSLDYSWPSMPYCVGLVSIKVLAENFLDDFIVILTDECALVIECEIHFWTLACCARCKHIWTHQEWKSHGV